jgi:hypothetical protein
LPGWTASDAGEILDSWTEPLFLFLVQRRCPHMQGMVEPVIALVPRAAPARHVLQTLDSGHSMPPFDNS